MEQLIRTIIEPLVDAPDQIQINKDEREEKVVFKLTVAPDDMGKIIGKQGRVAKAIRTLVYSASRNEYDKKVYLDIIDS
ncbi:KH domain-containing protein [Savagea sp. SN6]|uniref:RNA-binding protein KhpA n=1 Tax=Savagea serpentis TaxID=2785297 RepID=A0A8J7KDE0_9BACL|nr:KH domain-containing protein [Savagea serpentis]MBF4499916.1 KH domain-containing protein [Savagea serpentis]